MITTVARGGEKGRGGVEAQKEDNRTLQHASPAVTSPIKAPGQGWDALYRQGFHRRRPIETSPSFRPPRGGVETSADWGGGAPARRQPPFPQRRRPEKRNAWRKMGFPFPFTQGGGGQPRNGHFLLRQLVRGGGECVWGSSTVWRRSSDGVLGVRSSTW